MLVFCGGIKNEMKNPHQEKEALAILTFIQSALKCSTRVGLLLERILCFFWHQFGESKVDNR